MNYKEFDIFLINKDNWREQEELFYGYRTIDDNGYWLHVKKENDGKLYIRGSYIQPYISIYKSQDYWAISNNFYCLEQHLLEKGIKLTKNARFENWDYSKANEFTFCCTSNEHETLYNEINFNPNFSYLRIDECNGLMIHLLPIDCFTIPTEKSKQLILDWYKKYHNYLQTLKDKNLRAECSGGFDSRIIQSLYKDIPYITIISNWGKADDPESNNDGLYARQYLEKYQPKGSYEVIDTRATRGNKTEEQKVIDNNLKFLFYYGSYPLRDITKPEDIVEKPKNTLKYVVNGMSLELHKLLLGNYIYEICTTTRRVFVEKYLYNYYRYNRITICPFQDNDFLKIKGYNDLTFVYILLGLFNVNDPEIPYYTSVEGKNQTVYVKQDVIDKALEIFKED